MATQNNRAILPADVVGYFRLDEVLQRLLQTHHELRARCDAITIESRFFRQSFTLLFGLVNQVLSLFGRTEAVNQKGNDHHHHSWIIDAVAELLVTHTVGHVADSF